MTVRVGFLGAGLIAHFHALGLFESGEDVAFAGVYDPDRDRAEEFAAGWGGVCVGTEAEVLDHCDAVIICTWTSEHARLVDLVCDRGLPLLCEKPLAFDADAATAMAHVVEAAGVINQVGLLMRYSPPFAYLGHLVRDPAAGRVMSVVFRDDQYIPVQGMYASTWRGDKARAGAGTLLEHSIHDLDILEQVVGPLRSVSARSANSVATSFELASGGVGVHATIWHDVMERPSTRRIEIFCERRHLVLEDDELGPITWVTTGEEPRSLGGSELVTACHEAGLTVGNADAAFVRSVAEGRPAWPTFRDAIRPHRLVDAIYRSAASGGIPVDVD